MLLEKKQNKVAIIDIGSNSIRLAIYIIIGNIMYPIVNEKVICGLADHIDETGILNINGVEKANEAIAKFVRVSHIAEVETIYAIATSATRDALDGKDFVNNIEKKLNIKVRILSGEEEAYYTSLGIIAAGFKDDGIVIDLGGGSLEISLIDKGVIKHNISYPLGTLRLKNMAAEKGFEKTKSYILEILSNDFVLKNHPNINLYAIGGSLRAIAREEIEYNEYPIKITHNYNVDGNITYKFAKDLSNYSSDNIQELFADDPIRAATVKYAALILSTIIEVAKSDNITFSTYGVREGFLYNMFTDEQKNLDQFNISCEQLADFYSLDLNYGRELFNWCLQISQTLNINTKIVFAAAILSECARLCYPAYRSNMAYNMILSAESLAMTHKERLLIASSCYHRNDSKRDAEVMFAALEILDKQELKKSKILGLLFKLAYQISDGMPNMLSGTIIKIEQEKLILQFDQNIKKAIDHKLLSKKLAKLTDKIGLTESVIV
jgi:exopolyphosphatase / guanosine-5'-triphosphate,3'-diphosphate pyrophosphatase